MKKLILPFLAVAAIMCVIFTGCGDKDNNGSTTRTGAGNSTGITDTTLSSTSSTTYYSSTSSTTYGADSSESMFDPQDGRVSDTRSIID